MIVTSNVNENKLSSQPHARSENYIAGVSKLNQIEVSDIFVKPPVNKIQEASKYTEVKLASKASSKESALSRPTKKYLSSDQISRR